ncbi:helix-turn-helix domain-containing protein [Pararhodobacter aggregans]|uniref:helix-turn-helix domain-containing protein n=1 Tax=Pararhodobacter aggregans TaxID=404875 RepID=UPI003A8EDB7F
MTQTAAAMTQAAAPPRIWDTSDVRAEEAFDFYREGICAAFTPLAPELPPAARAGFRSIVRSYPMPEGALNHVSARTHQVRRTPAGIAASPEPCWYVNLQFDGICGIEQAGRRLDLHPGEVGLFDSDRIFTLDHSRRAGLRVASLLLPKRLVAADFAPGPHRLSDHPLYGRLLTEAAEALVAGAARGAPVAGLHGVLRTLVGLAAGAEGGEAGPLLRLRALIRANAARPGWSLGDCAAELGLSPRQVQRLLAGEDDGFTAALSRARLALAARMLRDPAEAHRPVAEIALAVGYGDPAPFSRAFRAAYGVAPGGWRRGA